ncbi:MAG: DUF2510 domain-containing protein [Microbacterium sp.]|uniref:DUF2510 domain-containing protein n=1 Tax=Microbacterium sp. TaxID=51671 RepID=UPI0039E6198A
MSDSNAIPAGWYPDPARDGTMRYWDGAGWAPATAPAVGVRPAPRRSPGLDPGTVWIWLIVLLPVIPVLLLLLVPWGESFDVGTIAQDPSAVAAEFGIFRSPAYWACVVLGYAVYGLNVWFAARDRRALLARGIDAPFPWYWAFLSSVYPIGRSVIVLRRTGRGAGPLWGIGAVMLVSLVISGVITWTIASAMTGAMQELFHYSGTVR